MFYRSSLLHSGRPIAQDTVNPEILSYRQRRAAAQRAYIQRQRLARQTARHENQLVEEAQNTELALQQEHQESIILSYANAAETPIIPYDDQEVPATQISRAQSSTRTATLPLTDQLVLIDDTQQLYDNGPLQLDDAGSHNNDSDHPALLYRDNTSPETLAPPSPSSPSSPLPPTNPNPTSSVNATALTRPSVQQWSDEERIAFAELGLQHRSWSFSEEDDSETEISVLEESEIRVFEDEWAEETAEEEPWTEITARSYTVEKVCDQLLQGIQGCSDDMHEAQRVQHYTNTSELDHCPLTHAAQSHGLRDILSQDYLPTEDEHWRHHASEWQYAFCGSQEIESEDVRPRRQPHIQVRIPRRDAVDATPKSKQQWSCATPPEERPLEPRRWPSQICLHAEESRPQAPTIAFDIDSCIGFATSLEFARYGIRFQAIPTLKQNVTSNLHISNPRYDSRTDENGDTVYIEKQSSMLRTPHFRFGSVEGAREMDIYLLWPYLQHDRPSDGPATFVSLTHDQYAIWFDDIFYPALHACLEAHVLQHLPSSYRCAFGDSRARQLDTRVTDTHSYSAQQAIHYVIQPHALGMLWQEIGRRTQGSAAIQGFRDPQICFIARGTKLQLKTDPTRPTLLECMEDFITYLGRCLIMEHVQLQRLYVDIGKEVCPSTSLVRDDRPTLDEEPQVYLWKKCCLETYLRWLFELPLDPAATPAPTAQLPKSGISVYTQSMLRDAVSVTVETPKRHTLRRGGLIYSQFYNSSKEIWDASKVQPFQHEATEELALDPQLRQAMRLQSGSKPVHAVPSIEKAYLNGKARVHQGTRDAYRKSFGVRQEYRISWALFLALVTRLTDDGNGNQGAILDDALPTVWPLRTASYLNYLRHNANKFCVGFEHMRGRCIERETSWEDTKMMVVFLRCLRFSVGSFDLARESSLWWSRRERRTIAEMSAVTRRSYAARQRCNAALQRRDRYRALLLAGDAAVDESEDSIMDARRTTWIGLGFSNTLVRDGYCWLEPRFDWERFHFAIDCTDQVMFGNDLLKNRYMRRGGHVEDFFTLSRQVDLALRWIEASAYREDIVRQLLDWLCHICLRQFRIDIYLVLERQTVRQRRPKFEAGIQPLCYEVLAELCQAKPHLVHGNTTRFKTPREQIEYLWLDGGMFDRKHWDAKPYRTLFRRVRRGLSWRQRCNKNKLPSRFVTRLWELLMTHDWLLPNAKPGALLPGRKNQASHRLWFSVGSRVADEHVWTVEPTQKRPLKRKREASEEFKEFNTRSQSHRLQAVRRHQQRQPDLLRSDAAPTIDNHIDDTSTSRPVPRPGVPHILDQFCWGRQAWRPGRPPQIPAYVQWSQAQWEQWLRERGADPARS